MLVSEMSALLTADKAKVISRATFTLVTSQYSTYTFEVDTVTTDVHGRSIKLQVKPPADAAIGE